MKKVKIYTTPTCTYCQQAKEFFKENSIKFEEINVTKDRKLADEMISISGQKGVPVILIDNNAPIIGFDQEKIEEVLNL
ncbi:MAG: glutaredoxin family protein [Nanoarchaeota archaeon]